MAGSIWKGSISFGLLNIPVSLEKAQEGSGLHFNMLDGRDYSPIKYKKINSKSGEEVPFEKIVKGYEYDKGEYVILSKEDFKAANPKATQTIDIEDFVSFDEIDLMFFDKPYYLVPQKSGVKAYFLLRDSLNETNKVAVGKIVIRTKMHLACVMARDDYLVLELMRFGHEVLETKEVSYLDNIVPPKISAKEVKMAVELIEGMSAKWDPSQYKDSYNDDILKVINKKIKSGDNQIVDFEEFPISQHMKGDNVVDLMPLLKKSLELKKKTKRKAQRKKTSQG